MQKRIEKIYCLSTSFTISLLYFVVTALVSLPLGIYYLTAGSREAEAHDLAITFFATPFIYGLASFLIALVVCFLYNAIARGTGGIKVKLEDE